jgi:hypothetical protein
MKWLGVWLVLVELAVLTTHAHRLNLTWEVVGTNVVLAADAEGTPAAGAAVECLTDAGDVWAGGTLDDQGRYVLSVPTTGGLNVSVNAGLGHRRSLIISASEFQATRAQVAGLAIRAAEAVGGSPSPRAGGSADAVFSTLPRVLVGLALLLAAAAAWMSRQNSRRLTALEQRLKDDAR